MKVSASRWVLIGYAAYLVLPLYWLLSMAIRTNAAAETQPAHRRPIVTY